MKINLMRSQENRHPLRTLEYSSSSSFFCHHLECSVGYLKEDVCGKEWLIPKLPCFQELPLGEPGRLA